MRDMFIKNAKLRNHDKLQQILIEDGKFKEIGTTLHIPEGVETIDAKGNLTVPPFVDPHIHLDAVLVSGKLKRANKSGTLLEAIDIWGEWKPQLTKKMLIENAKEAIKWYIANGVLRIRTHADSTDPTLLTVESLLELREEVKDYIDLQVVAFPQDGIYTSPKALELLKKSIEMGVDAVGGAPHIEYSREDGVRDVETVYELAEKYGKLVDIHVDETGDPHSRFVEVMAKESINRGMGKMSAASHAVAMHNYDNDYAFKLIGYISKADMNIIANPYDNVILQNRRDGYPRKRGITRVDELLQAGINCAVGHDSIMDPWYSMGKGNMITAANLLMHLGHLNGADQIPQLFDMITLNSAKLMNLKDYGIEAGNSADLVILDAENVADAIRLTAECLYVIRKGKIISETVPADRKIKWEGKEEKVDFKVR